MPEDLLGRGDECQALDDLLAGAMAGQSAALILRGEPGIGKTALLEYLERRCVGMPGPSRGGVESEMELAFAGLHQLCRPLLDELDRCPRPRRRLSAPPSDCVAEAPPDRFLIGLAVLSLLSEAATEMPLVCLIDDAQWLDQASLQSLTFVARRLAAESVVMVFAARLGEDERAWAGVSAADGGRSDQI